MYRHADNAQMDWKQIIFELQATGLTQTQLADRIAVAQSAISELATGKTTEPKFSTGDRLRALHKKLCGRKRAPQAQPQPTPQPAEGASNG